MKIVILGAHPDDPESGCGGLTANAVEAGQAVHFIYGTAYREGRTFFGRPEKEVRTEEALEAAARLGATAEVLDYPHEHLDVNLDNIRRFTDLLRSHQPDLVIAHWPVDTHPDHRAIGTLALSAALSPEADFVLYFFEVLTGQQSLHFHPTHYVDISAVAERKHQALLCHRSQDGEAIWQAHELMHRTRGHECGVDRAEAYIRLERGGTVGQWLPGR